MGGDISGRIWTQQTLGELIGQSLNGDREAFGHIVRHYQGLVSGITFGMTGDHHKSEDLAQETFLVAWKQLAELRDLQKLPQWFCGIARTLVLNDRSKNAAKPKAVSYDTNEIGEKTALSSPMARDSDPLEHAIREERNRLVAEAITKIPERYRVPLIMSIRSGMSTSEIAATLEISEDTFYQRISRAKKFLRTELEKQVEHSVRTTGPGEFFSLGVVAALPVVANAFGGKALALTAVASEPVLVAQATGSSSSAATGSTATAFSFWGFLKSTVSVAVMFASWLCLFIGVLPGIWFSIRNAPTLAARRFLVLTSLRAHFLFVLVFSTVFLRLLYFLNFSGTSVQYTELLFSHSFGVVAAGFAVVIAAILSLLELYALLALCISPLRYRRILRGETGLRDQSQERSQTSDNFAQRHLVGAIWLWGIAIIAVYALTTYIVVIRLFDDQTQWSRAWAEGYGWTCWQSFFHYHGTLYVIVGLLSLLVFVRTHIRFLAICKNEAAFAAAGPIVDRNTPFRFRWLLEWVVTFGVFILACLGLAFYDSHFTAVPRSPFLLISYLVLLVAWSGGAAAANIRFPWLRLPATFLTVIGLIAMSMYYWRKVRFFAWIQSETYPFQTFFDSTVSWPVILTAMLIGYCLLFAILLTLALGAMNLRCRASQAKAEGQPEFFRRKTLAIVYGTMIAMLLLAVPFVNAHWKNRYFTQHLIVRINADHLSDESAERLLGLADTIIQSKSILSAIVASNSRSRLLLQLGRYDEAIAGYDELLNSHSWSSPLLLSSYEFRFTSFRGMAKLLKGDYDAAIADFDLAEKYCKIDGPVYNYAVFFYHRAVAKEKKGDLPGALADYSKAIGLLERFAEPDPIWSAISRPESSSERTLSLSKDFVGYEISFDGLKTIRENLQQSLENEVLAE